MLQRLVNALRGSVRLEVEGAFPERFLNLCAQRGVLFWNVEWLEPTRLRLTVARLVKRYAAGRSREIPELVTLRRGTSMKVRCDRVSMVNLDGERLDADELSITLSAKKVGFFFPKGASWKPHSAKFQAVSEKTREKRRKQKKIGGSIEPPILV